jgi:hypothetical protein
MVSSPIWVSADPECGKSVLSKSLVGGELINTESQTACHIFNDNNDNPKSVENALYALLNQNFSRNPTLLKYAILPFQRNGAKLPRLGFLDYARTSWTENILRELRLRMRH